MKNMDTFDIAENRGQQKWTRKQQVGRIMWALAGPLYRWSPRPLWGWRRFLLKLFGATIGQQVHLFPTVRITIPWNLSIGEYTAIGDHAILYALGPISIGKRVTISQYAHLCAGSHDYESKTMTLTKPPIDIGDDSWVCTEAFVGPGIRIGENCIIGARSVVVKSVESNHIVGGNPATTIKVRGENA